MPDRRSDLQRPAAELRRGPDRLGPDRLEQGLDRLVSAGRQLVDGVSGARPGSRVGQRPAGRPGPAPGRSRLGELGRWVEDRLDWILEDEDDWREPWQEPRPQRLQPSRGGTRSQPRDEAPPPAPAVAQRRPLEAISRRDDRRRPSPAVTAPQPPAAEDWPDDTLFSRPRWQRSPIDPGRGPDLSGDAARAAAERARDGFRPLPRSSRRRPG